MANPYLPPTADPDLEISSVLDDALKTREHVEFGAEVTRRDLVDALNCRTFRRDLARLRRARWLVLIPLGLVLVLAALQRSRTGTIPTSTQLIFVGVLLFAGYAFLVHWWIRARHARMNDGLLGSIKGHVDRNSLYIEGEAHVRYRRMQSLVGVAHTKRQLVLGFDPSFTLFEVIPKRGFDDPDTAELLALNLATARPFNQINQFDVRRMELPTEDPRFRPGENAVFFSGEVRREDIQGTPLQSAHRKARITALIQTFVVLSIALFFVYAITRSGFFTIIAGVLLSLVFARACMRVAKAPLSGQANEEVLFRSAGWFDHEGLVSMTSIGQSQLKWSGLESAIVTDRVIAIRPRQGAVWYLISRPQFPEASEWSKALRIVREKLPATGLQ